MNYGNLFEFILKIINIENKISYLYRNILDQS